MARQRKKTNPEHDWPTPPRGRDVVLHTRVVTDTGGGPDKTILLSASYLAQSDYWLAAAYMHPPDDPGFDVVRRRAADFGCPLISVPDRGALDHGVFQRMLAICKHLDVKVWHGHDYKSNLIGLSLRPFWPMKLVSTLHGWVKHTAKTPLYYAVDRWCLPYYQKVICVSDDLLAEAQRLGVPRDRLTLIPNGVDEKTYCRRAAPAESPLRAQLGTPAGRFVVGAVGRLSAEKAFNNLVKTVPLLLDRGLNVELWIAGDGEERQPLERLIAHSGLEGRVRLLGFRADTADLYQAMDLFVLSSLREGLPNVVLEAMATSVPVVSTRVAGIPRLIEDGQNGLLCDAGDVAALAAPIGHLLADAALRQRLARQARATIERDFSFSRRMAREKAVYDQVCGRQGDNGSVDAPAIPAGVTK